MEDVIWGYSLKKGCEGPVPIGSTITIANDSTKTSTTTTPEGDTIIEI